MKTFFQQLSFKQFKVITALLLLTGDVLFVSYVHQKVAQRTFMEQSLGRSLSGQGMSLDDISPEDKEAAYQLIANLVKMTLIIFLAFHVILILLFYLGKKSPWKYFKYYSLMAALSLPLFLVFSFHVILLAAIPVYLAVTLGLFFRPWDPINGIQGALTRGN